MPTPLCFILLVGCACCFPALLADDAKPKEDAKDDAKLLEGSWKAVALEADGKKASAEELEKLKGRWTFRGLELVISDTNPVKGENATVKLDSSKTPKHFDLVALGPKKDKTMQGIYKFEKDRLFICSRGQESADKGRPTEFTTTAGSDLGMITLERVKE